MSSVALVEDEQSTRRRLAAVIEAAPELTLAGVAADVASGLRLLAEAKPDVLLTDLGLPDGSGIELIRESRRTLPDTLCLVITVFADETHVMDAIASGAAGYVLKDGTEDEICRSIHELTAGGSPISPSIARYLLRRFQPTGPESAQHDSNSRVHGLTERELEVVRMVAKGFSAPEIARLLSLSPNTIKTHVRHIYGKLEVTSRGEAVYEAVQRGIIGPEA